MSTSEAGATFATSFVDAVVGGDPVDLEDGEVVEVVTTLKMEGKVTSKE